MTRKNRIVLFIMFGIGIAIFLFSLREISFLCMFLSLVFEALVIKILVQRQIKSYPFFDALRVPMLEQLFNGITPFSTGGQPAQLFALMQSGLDAGRATSSTLMKFIVYQAMIVVNFVLCLLIGFNFIQEKIHTLAWLVVFGFIIHLAVIVSLLMVMYWYDFTKKFIKVTLLPIKWIFNDEKYRNWNKIVDEKIDNFYEESLKLKSNWKLLLKISAITFVQLSVYYIIPYFILLSLGVTHVNVIMVISMHVLIVMVVSLFPIPGGAGGAEYSFSVIFSSFIGTGSKLVLAMLLWRIVTYYFGMLSGLIAMLIQPKRIVTKK